ncbi:hypothetical protein ABFS83_07G053500 [Erythranthe nasuta]
MEGIREITRSYYSRASEEEKKSVKEFFENMVVNEHGKIGRAEFKRSVSACLATDAIFEKLDTNGDGYLDFEEVLCLYYIVNKLNVPRCAGCYELLVGPYFSCLLCVGKSPLTYDLCCGCYRRSGEDLLLHEHSYNYMMDNHTLVAVFKDRTAEAEKNKWKKEMEELRQTAKDHYRAGSPKVQDLAFEFFKSMDTNEDSTVDLSEFLAFMRSHEGRYSNMHNRYFFDDLDLDSNGTLDFSEVMALYYIIKSRRPFCDFCRKFIPGIFFSCVECFNDSQAAPFDLCPVCYRSKRCKHGHNGRVQFLDNYTLLEAKRDSDLAIATGVNTNTNTTQLWASSSSNAVVPVQPSNNPTYYTNIVDSPNSDPNYTNAIVPATSNNWGKWKVALTALEVALHVGSLSGACTIL